MYLVFQACKECDLGTTDIDMEADNRQEELYVPNWFSCDIKTGVSSGRRKRAGQSCDQINSCCVYI